MFIREWTLLLLLHAASDHMGAAVSLSRHMQIAADIQTKPRAHAKSSHKYEHPAETLTASSSHGSAWESFQRKKDKIKKTILAAKVTI